MIEPARRAIICGETMVTNQLLATMLFSRILRNCSSAMPAIGP